MKLKLTENTDLYRDIEIRDVFGLGFSVKHELRDRQDLLELAGWFLAAAIVLRAEAETMEAGR